MEKPNRKFEDRSYNSADSEKRGFNRDDSNRDYKQNLSSFAKDKRKRISRTEKAVPLKKSYDNDRPRTERPEDGSRPVKRSFNPNFTEDNKLRSGNGGRPQQGRSNNKFSKAAPGKPYGNKKPAGKRPFNSKPRYDKENYPKFPAPIFTDDIRLNRYLSIAGICSRREADENIRLGLVTVNGEVITELGTKVTSSDIVRFNGSVVRTEKKVYIVMNKPKGFVTTVEDPKVDKTVMELIKNACNERVYPVGRLDKNSLGVLLFTNDGDLTKKLTHPSFNKKKIYQVSLDKPLTKADMDTIAKGVQLEDGLIYADEISYVKDNKKEIGIEIHSGRNRIIRRIFEHLGYKVTKLDRVYFAGMTKKNLKRGAWRFLSPREVDALKSGMYE